MHLPELIGNSGLLLLTATNAPIKPWISRKILHIGIGTLLLNADINDPNVVNAIYSTSFLGAAFITNKGLNKVSDDRKSDGFIKDIGIFGYIVACFTCLLLTVPYREIAPLFYADPAGAIVGRTTNSTKIWENKTITGSSAVFFTSLLSVHGEIEDKIVSSFIIMIIELFGGKIDNSLIAAFLITKYLLQNN